jgi:hypothetical protein
MKCAMLTQQAHRERVQEHSAARRAGSRRNASDAARSVDTAQMQQNAEQAPRCAMRCAGARETRCHAAARLFFASELRASVFDIFAISPEMIILFSFTPADFHAILRWFSFAFLRFSSPDLRLLPC